MATDIRDKVLRIATGVALVLVIVGGIVITYPAYRRGQDLKVQESELRARIKAKTAEIAQLRKNQDRFRTDADFVESIARQNRRVFPGELVFIFQD